MTRAGSWALPVLLLVSLGTAQARADDAADADALASEARAALARQGDGAADPAEAERIVDLLERSISLHPTLPAYFNLTVAHRRGGHVLRSVALLEEIIDGRHGALTAEQLASARRQLERTRGDLATLVITAPADSPLPIAIDLDGHGAGSITDTVPLRVLVDPGAHRLQATAAGWAFEEERVVTERGALARVALRGAVSTIALVPDAALAPSPPPSEDPTPWIALGIGGGVVLIAGAVILGVVLSSQGPELPGPIVQAVVGR